MMGKHEVKKAFLPAPFQSGGGGRRSGKKLVAFTAAFLLWSYSTPADTRAAGFEEAVRQAAAGNHVVAEKMYDELLLNKPESVRFRLGRAYVRSWQKRYSEAEGDFKKVLEKEPENTDALTGLGYTYSWSGRYTSARATFIRALNISPGTMAAEKGIAFTALWQGNANEAVRRFRKIVRKNSGDAEASAALGQALVAAGKPEKARKSFQTALNLEPGRADSVQAIKAIDDQPPRLELSIWGGHTFRLNSTSIRSAEIGGWINRDLKIWTRYDNALSLDNPGLVRLGKKIPSIFLGGLTNWGEIYTTRVEAGKRELLNNVDQYLFEGEQVVYLQNGRSFKVGGFAGIRDDSRTDWNLYTGTGIPLPSRFRIEPTLYYTKTGGIDEYEWRVLVPVEYTFTKGVQAVVYLAAGRVNSEIAGASGGLWAASTAINVPLSKSISGHFLLRHEAPPAGDDLTVISFGLTFKLFKE